MTESEIKKMEKSDSQALVYTASNYRLAEARREEEVKKGFIKQLIDESLDRIFCLI